MLQLESDERFWRLAIPRSARSKRSRTRAAMARKRTNSSNPRISAAAAHGEIALKKGGDASRSEYLANRLILLLAMSALVAR